jgi:hypothetical protein
MSDAASLEQIRARRDANIAKGREQLLQLRKAIDTAPIFLCSTHGEYDRKIDPVAWTVPANTFIFEAQTIGDLTLTSIDIPLWDLLQGGRRWGFRKYLFKQYGKIKRKGIPVFDIFKETLASLILYKPGDKIYERVLSIGGGRDDKVSGARTVYTGMGFYRFDADAPAYPYRGYGRRAHGEAKAPYEILPELHAQMVGDINLQLTDHSFVESVTLINRAPTWRNGAPIQDVEFRTASLASQQGPEAPRIFIFSSCAAVSMENSSEGVRRWEEIASLQQQRIIEAMSDLEIYSLLGGGQGSTVPDKKVKSGKPDPGRESSMNLRHKNVAPSRFFVPPPVPGAIEFFSKEDTDLDPEFLFLSEEERLAVEKKGAKGGRTRRVKRKSSGKRNISLKYRFR